MVQLAVGSKAAAGPSVNGSARTRQSTAVVCTRGRPDQLRRVLVSLERQSLAPTEILVIDNAQPGEPDAQLVASQFGGVRYLHVAEPGLDVARNAGLAHASTPIVAFLDDDAVAHRDWLLHLLRAFDNEEVAACTGRVEPLSLDWPGQVLFEANGGFGRGAERIELPQDTRRRLHGVRAPLIAWAVSVGSGCSFAVRRGAVLPLGGFDVWLDRGPELPGGGDHDLLWRLLQAGWSIVYEPAALAWHEHRMLESEAAAQIASHQRGLIAFLLKSLIHANPRGAPQLALFLFWRLMKPAARLVRRAFGRDPLPASALLSMWAACWRGLVSYGPLRRPLLGQGRGGDR
jgi:GT2 family glycosyltransferase